ncbi:hypothetical protein [Enterococcus caccae]|uniref:Peptidase M50 domain-containing protein n=1 Tax=Enterococcus caccae ATCC BAA-1240 TaxID=1158612 RepID=R3WNJ4_9ENTE|nr:hypothetical protein [Enterococcus caccae]EOL43410.1 hypothetical protein UC7_02739 [Enterococcus caccae ATCC BAA-1240]EOT68190.1 hypothetical protein I580_00573 [Enterococcus caccae ATCC BAA-1240]OJG26946.1 hypothetical protein RU98_GL003037 [Enterococcus caccae]
MKKKLKKVGSILISMVLGAIGGYVGGGLIARQVPHLSVLDIILFILALILSYILHIIIHEAGHGIFGKVSGYKMVSYRIFSFMWIWQKDSKIEFRRFKVPGTLGQCLMAPPTYVKGKFPFRLYLLGGILANLITSALIGILCSFHSPIAIAFIIVGLFTALTNAVPIGFNDGMSIKVATSSEEQQYLLYMQFEVNYLLNQGISYQELPKSFFELVPSIPTQTYFNDSQQFLRAARFLEEQDWPHLNEQLELLWSRLDELISLYQIEVKKEMIFSLSITKPEDQRLAQLWSEKKVKMSLKQPLMGNKRIEAAYYYFVQNDDTTALDCLKAGKSLVNKAPNPGDAKVELKLNEWLQNQILIRRSDPSS